MKVFKVDTGECIGCRACAMVAAKNFYINDKNIAYVKNQPKNQEELDECEQALDVCPVMAISTEEIEQKKIKDSVNPTIEISEKNIEIQKETRPILAKDTVKATLDAYPQLKPVLTALSPRFKKLQIPTMYNTVARFATFRDAAKLADISVCEILYSLNKVLGTKNELIKKMPECISEKLEDPEISGEEINWEENNDRFIYNIDTISEIIEKVSNLKAQESLVILSVEKPEALLKTIVGLGLKFNIEKNREFRISVFNPKPIKKNTDWMERKEDFEQLDVRNMQTDPFDVIIKRSYEIEDDSGFILIQSFEPYPLINMLNEMGFESITEDKGPGKIWVYFHKKNSKTEANEIAKDKPSVVIQSATPVAYPVIMRLLQSDKIRKAIQIKELKVWEETEKHLSWIVNGKADISFSALITSAKLKDSDIKIPALFVWDNFYILTRGYKASQFQDLKGRNIHTPLFEEAPPAKITKYLMKAKGLNADDFNFIYGKPFGRPEAIFRDFVTGKADTVILREPEASYAIKALEKIGEEISIISYNEIWNDINKNFGSFPNAGLVLKGEFARKYPELTKVFLEELKDAIIWVNKNKHEAAKLSFDLMRQPVDSIELFLNRVKFEYVEGDELAEKVKDYFNILYAEGIVETKISDDFLKIFRL